MDSPIQLPQIDSQKVIWRQTPTNIPRPLVPLSHILNRCAMQCKVLYTAETKGFAHAFERFVSARPVLNDLRAHLDDQKALQ
jgi:hypothetical protein